MSHNALLVLNRPSAGQSNISTDTISALIAFKASEDKNDPTRAQGRHGPFEELSLRKTGKLPADYYEAGNDQPWGLRVQESRSNVLWQVLSGAMDQYPDFAANYMALALDTALGDADYTKELGKLNKDWGDYQFVSNLHGDHQHSSMSHVYGRVACPACSMLTALSIRDDGMKTVFEDMRSMKPQDRKAYLSEQGLLGLLDTMIPDVHDQATLKNIVK